MLISQVKTGLYKWTACHCKLLIIWTTNNDFPVVADTKNVDIRITQQALFYCENILKIAMAI